MRVLLVAVPYVDEVDGVVRPVGNDAVRAVPPLAVYQLAAVLRAAGHDVAVADRTAVGDHGLGEGDLAGLAAVDLVGVSATTLAWPAARRVAAQVKARRSGLPVVAGGVHPSLFDAWVLERSDVDLVVRGEAERALPALCRVLEAGGDLAAVPALSWRDRSGAVVRNPAAPRLRAGELLDQPLPAWDLLPDGAYRGLALETSRGCPWDCSFCSTPHRRSWRPQEPADVVDRLEATLAHVRRTRERTVYVVDDEFTVRPSRVRAVLAEVDRRGLLPQLLFEGRAPDLDDDALLEALAPHTAQFLVGAECGYDEGLVRVGKKTTVAGLEATASRLAAHGMAARADFSFILGLPWEGIDEVRATVAFARHLVEDHGVRAILNWYAQLPGSRLWDQARSAGLVHPSQFDEVGFARDPALFHSGVRLRPAEIRAVCDELAGIGAGFEGRWRSRWEWSVPPAVAHAEVRPQPVGLSSRSA